VWLTQHGLHVSTRGTLQLSHFMGRMYARDVQ
jgi:hypothetical protein